MAIADDFSVAANGDVRHVSGSTTYTVLELHRWLQDLADDSSSSGNDVVDITSDDPSERATDQIVTLKGTYNIDDDAAEYFYGGSISQASGATLYSGLQVLGSVNSVSTQLQIVQNNALLTNYWGTGLNNAGSTLLKILVKSRDAGVDIDGKRIRVQAREWGDSFADFDSTLGQGESVAAISTTPDAQNTTSVSAVSAYSDVTNTEGFQTIDLNNGNGAREYYSKWTYGTLNQKAIWEWAKMVQRRGTVNTIHGMNGELFVGVTHTWAYDTEASGPFTEDETLTWPTGGGILLALDDDGTTGNHYIQLTSGVAPANNDTITGQSSNATALVNGTPSSKTKPKVFIGSYTGTFIGAYGVGIDADDLTASDTLVDLGGTTQAPPNNVSVTVAGVTSGDRVLLARDNGSGDIEENTYHTTSGNDSGNGTLVVEETINSDDPNAGNVRVWDGSQFDIYAYTSFSGSTFTLTGTLSTNYGTSANTFVPFIDQTATGTSISKTIVYSADINVVGRVRNGGVTPIKPFPITGQIGDTGFSVTAIRTSDS